MNDDNVTVEQELGQETGSATAVAPVSGTDATGMLSANEGASLITCRDGQNRLLMLSICAAFRAD